MEEDVEIELLFNTHGQMLMEAAATEIEEGEEGSGGVCEEDSEGEPIIRVERVPKDAVADKKFSSRKPRRRKKLCLKKKHSSRKKKRLVCDDSATDVDELLDTEILSCVIGSRIRSTPDSDDEINTCFESNNEKKNCIDEILGDDSAFTKRSLELEETQVENDSSRNADDRFIFELRSLQKMIDKREGLLEKLERKLKGELIENEGEQRKVRETINSLSHKETRKYKPPNLKKCFFKKFGKPYFHDSDHFPAPPNKDEKTKNKNGELIITSMPKLKYWRKSHKDILQDAIQLTLIKENSEKLVREIEKLKCMLTNVPDEQTEREIEGRIVNCQKKLQRTKSMSYLDLLANENPDREYDWMKYSASDLNESHSPEECKRFWHLYLKPTINKSRWERSEDEKLKESVEEMGVQDWERIAQSLGTSRTQYQCVVHYSNRVCDKQEFAVGKWTKEEDERLLNVINSAKVGEFIPWTKVASYMGDRNHCQIYNRYVNCLDPKLVKGRFSKEEDLLIVAGIEVFGATYKEMASLMSNRSHNQIRERYERHLLNKTAKTGSFSLEEDERLLKLVDKHGERNFALVAKEMKTRSRTQVRQRYNCIMQMIRTKPGWTPAQVKRRSNNKVAKRLTKTQKTVEVLRREVEHVEKTLQLTKLEKDTFRIEKLKELRDTVFIKKYDIKKYKRKTFSENSDINSQLLEFFKYQHSNGTEESSILQNSLDSNAYLNEILMLAKYFGHDLQLPKSEDEILKNNSLSLGLKMFLVETLKQQVGKVACNKQNSVEISCPTTEREPLNIDYVEPEVDNTLMMEEHWHNASVNISNLNFSEFFKRTVFDYSIGMHQDIWSSKINRLKVTGFSDETHIVKLHNNQPYFIPPNGITTLGYKSILLSRSRLKHDSNKLPDDVDVKCETTQFYHLHDKFQETLLSLFYCPKVLSVTDISSTLLSPIYSSTSQTVPNPESTLHLLNNSNKKSTFDIVSKFAQPIKDDALQEQKMKRCILEHNKTHQRQLKEYKLGITYRRKMNIEHLVNRKRKQSMNISNTQAYRRNNLKRKKDYCAGLKSKETVIATSDSENTNNSDILITMPIQKVPTHTYSKTRQSLKRHINSDKCLEPTIKKSVCINSENTKSTQPESQEADNSCLLNHSKATSSTK